MCLLQASMVQKKCMWGSCKNNTNNVKRNVELLGISFTAFPKPKTNITKFEFCIQLNLDRICPSHYVCSEKCISLFYHSSPLKCRFHFTWSCKLCNAFVNCPLAAKLMPVMKSTYPEDCFQASRVTVNQS